MGPLWVRPFEFVDMAEELAMLWEKLEFTGEEDESITLGSNSTKAAKERGKNCLVMKILSRRSIMLDTFKEKSKDGVEAK